MTARRSGRRFAVERRLSAGRRFAVGRPPIRLRQTIALVLLWLASAGALAGIIPVLVSFGPRPVSVLASGDPQSIYALVEVAALFTAAVGLLWITGLLTLLVICRVLRSGRIVWHRGEQILRAISPRIVRNLLATSLGLGISAAAMAPAHAEMDDDPFDVSLSWGAQTVSEAHDLGASELEPEVLQPAPAAEAVPIEAAPTDATPTDTGPTGAASPNSGLSGTDSASTNEAVTGAEVITVAEGDSLWKIAQRHLGNEATDAQIDAAWRQWHEHNAEQIGPDPNLIFPGMKLTVPN